MPNPNVNPVTYEGAFHGSTRAQVNGSFVQQIFDLGTVASLTNPTVATDLVNFSLPGGSMVLAGQAIEIYAAGTYNLGAASTLVFTIKMGGVTLATFTTSSQATTAVTLSWNMTIFINVNATGGLETHGYLNIDLGATLAAASTTFNDSNTAPVTTVVLANANAIEVMANLGTGNAGSNISCRQCSVEFSN